jgi:hypothetical protein
VGVDKRDVNKLICREIIYKLVSWKTKAARESESNRIEWIEIVSLWRGFKWPRTVNGTGVWCYSRANRVLITRHSYFLSCFYQLVTGAN